MNISTLNVKRHIADPSRVINEYSSGSFFDDKNGNHLIRNGSDRNPLARQGYNPNCPAA